MKWHCRVRNPGAGLNELGKGMAEGGRRAPVAASVRRAQSSRNGMAKSWPGRACRLAGAGLIELARRYG